MQTARYTAENAKTISVRHFTGETDDFPIETRTFVNLSWENPNPDLGDDFIATSYNGRVLYHEAAARAAAEMQEGHEKGLRLAPLIEARMAEIGCSYDDAADAIYREDDGETLVGPSRASDAEGRYAG